MIKIIMKKISFVKVVFVALTVLVCGSGEVLADQWSKTYGGTGSDKASMVQQTSDGGYIVAGNTDSFGAGKRDMWVLKLDVSGNIQWQRTYGGSEDDEASSVQQTADGGYIVAGYTSSFGTGKKDAWVLKLDKDGSVEWQKTYGGSEDDEAFSIHQAADGGYIVAGYTSSSGAGKKDVWVLKLDKDGSVGWQKAYGGGSDDVAYSIQQTPDGGYILAGSTGSFGKGNNDMWALKLDESGNVDWQKTYGGIGDDGAYSIQPTSDGGYIIGGWTSSYSTKVKPWILKLDSIGTIEQQFIFLGGMGEDRIYFIRETSDGGYILAGSTDSYGLGKKDAWIIKIQPDGTILQSLFGGTGDDEAFYVEETLDRGFAVAGWSNSFGAGSYDAWVLKLDSKLGISGCSIIGNSFAYAGSTGISGVSTNVTSQDTGLLPQISQVNPVNTEVTPGSICMVEGPDISVDPTSVDFGSVVLGSSSSYQTITIMNVGSKDLVIGNLDITGTYHPDFGILDDGCSGQTVKPFSKCTVETVFGPHYIGVEIAVLTIPSNDSDFSNMSILMKGKGVAPISPTEPADHASFSSCSLYEIPTFAWDVEGFFKSYEVQFSKSEDFSNVAVKVKASSNMVVPKSNLWKQAILIPGEFGGPVYWRVYGIFKSGKTAFISLPRSITIQPAQPVKNAKIDPTGITTLPTLSWENNCNAKFKVWFGNDAQFSKKYTFSPPTIKNPLNNNGEFSQTLTSQQWGSIRKLVGNQSGATIYWKVESWDGASRESQTATMSFVLGE
jgi:hypothetical protein